MSHDDDNDDQHDEELKPIKGHFTSLGGAKLKPPVWAIADLITIGATLMIGPAKDVFKTTTAMALGCLIAGHKHKALPPEWAPKIKGPVLIFEAEGDDGELNYMCRVGIGCTVPDDESMMVCSHPEEYRLDDEDAVDQMLEWIRERDPAMVLLDPLINFHALDEKEANQMLRILQPLRLEAMRRQMVFMILHHARKIEEGKLYTPSDGRGSSAIIGMMDNILTMSPGKAPYEIIMDRRGKKGPAFLKPYQLSIWDRIGMSAGKSLSQVEKMIIRSIMHGFKSIPMIASDTGIAVNTIGKVVTDMKKSGLVKFEFDKIILTHKYTPEELK